MTQTNTTHKGFLRAAVLVASVLACVTFSAVAPSLGQVQAGEFMYKCDGIAEKSLYSAFNVKIYQGENGWFFRQGDLESFFEFPDDTMEMLQHINGALTYQGMHLIILPMLPRGIAEGSYVPNGGILTDRFYDAGFAEDQFNELIEMMRLKGLDVINVADVLKKDPSFDPGTFYFKRDIHWTPEGAGLIAQATASHIRGMQGNVEHEVEFETRPGTDTQLHKATFNTILNELCQSKIPPEEVNVYDTKQKVDSLNDLLDEDNVNDSEPVHVIGSSYTDDVTVYNFDGFLRQYLKQNVGGFSISGGGVDQSIYAWAQNPNGLGKRPKFIVWEFADFVDLRKLTRQMETSIVPAIIGDCSDDLKLAEKTFDETDTVDLDLPALVGKASDHYLAYTFTNKALTGFQSSYSYANGPAKKVSFENPSRVSGLAKLYQALPGGTRNAPVHVRLEIEGAAKSAGSVKLCRYPERIFQNAATSN
ncbi:alginate O-acetyltransferase AlgX-related protein [Rhizobium mongolense]|uniref:alginate O-acetyltransferase AlgX-related protein n=1 Tax=Rhizobium mongolense TaxID=57676 RepID=UPI0034A13ECF